MFNQNQRSIFQIIPHIICLSSPIAIMYTTTASSFGKDILQKRINEVAKWKSFELSLQLHAASLKLWDTIEDIVQSQEASTFNLFVNLK